MNTVSQNIRDAGTLSKGVWLTPFEVGILIGYDIANGRHILNRAEADDAEDKKGQPDLPPQNER